MRNTTQKLSFEILIDESFYSFCTDPTLIPIDKKKVLSLLNDFEDGKWRFSKFQSFIWDHIAETALSHKERESLINHSLMTAAAKNLRLTDQDNDVGRGSELAEIVLYGIMKQYYNALPVVPKIFYKQNPQDNAKGSDSVHIVLEGEDDFSIWFGEAKFYTSIEDARLREIVQSVENSLSTDKLKKENAILTSLSELNHFVTNIALRERILSMLSPQSSVDLIKSKLHIPILLLHECEITKSATGLSPEYKDDIKAYHEQRAQAYFKKQLNKISSLFKYSEINFHVILFPVPSKKEVVDKFINAVQFYKNQ